MITVSAATASAHGTFDIPCRCGSCGVQWTLRIKASGLGIGDAMFLSGAKTARKRAKTAARYDAADLARRAVEILDCQSCSRPLVHGQPHWLRKIVPAIVFLVASSTAIALFNPSRRAAWGYPFLGIVLSVVLVVSRWHDRQKAIATANGSVQWFRGEPPDKPYVGLKCGVCEKKIESRETGVRCPQCGAATHTDACSRDHTLEAHTPGQAAYRKSAKSKR